MTGDGLEGVRAQTSGDVGAFVGYGSASGNSGSGGGSVPDARVSGPAAPAFSLARLTAEVGNDVTVVEQFVADFLALLDGRLENIATSLFLDDDERAVVALLSLESSGAMLGATELVAEVRGLRSAVRDGRRDEVSPRQSSVRDAAEDLRRALLLRRTA